jgi:helix-turn-helix protein
MTANATHERDQPPFYLTQKEAAAYVRVSVGYLRNSSCPKVLLPPGRGRRPLVRYRRDDLDHWMTQRRVAAHVP